MTSTRWIVASLLVVVGLTFGEIAHGDETRAGGRSSAREPASSMTWALHFSIVPTLFEPAETPGLITPFSLLYALHDALVKPMPGKVMTPSLAESWTVSPDGLVYEFVLRRNAKF